MRNKEKLARTREGKRRMAVVLGKVFFAIVLVSIPSLARAGMIDLTSLNANGYDDANIGLFYQSTPPESAGSGVFNTFLSIKNNGSERGYNTNGTTEFNTFPVGTRAIQLSEIPTVNIGGTLYREFLLDINESNGIGQEFLSLDALEIYINSTNNLTGYNSGWGDPVYNLSSNWIALNSNLSTGSGRADMSAYIPNSLFATDNSKYVYLYSKFGDSAESGTAPRDFTSNSGFEEWGIGDPSRQQPVPEPATLLLLGSGLLGLAGLRKRV